MSKSILSYSIGFEEATDKPYIEVRYADKSSKRGVQGTVEFIEVGKQIVEQRGDRVVQQWMQEAEGGQG